MLEVEKEVCRSGGKSGKLKKIIKLKKLGELDGDNVIDFFVIVMKSLYFFLNKF